VEVYTKDANLDKIQKGKHDLSEKEIVAALNSLRYIAPHASEVGRFSALSDNGIYLSLESDGMIVTAFKPDGDAGAYFNKYAVLNRVRDLARDEIIERVKKWYEKL